MVIYFIIFLLIGGMVGKIIKNEVIIVSVIVLISILWGLTHHYIWGFVSLGEMLLGYFIFKILQSTYKF